MDNAFLYAVFTSEAYRAFMEDLLLKHMDSFPGLFTPVAYIQIFNELRTPKDTELACGIYF